MSTSTIPIIIGRIKTATPESGIAVFKTQVYGKFNAVFADTITTKCMIDKQRDMYVGTFHGEMDLLEVETELKSIYN